MTKRIDIGFKGRIVDDINSSIYGSYIILTVEDYNSIVRQLNLLKLLMKEALPLSARANNPIYDKLFSTNNEVVE